MAELESVRWIEPVTQPRIFNDRARTIMRVDPIWQNQKLFGAGQIIAVADSGLDTGNPATLSPDFSGRLAAAYPVSPAVSDWGDQFGHGTHVAGSVAGAGIQSGANPAQGKYAGSFAGIAPQAELVIQAFDALPDGTVVGLDPDYYRLFARAYADGARLHTNSWGDPTGPPGDPEATYGGYPLKT
jgi:subtilisin family serine protease